MHDSWGDLLGRGKIGALHPGRPEEALPHERGEVLPTHCLNDQPQQAVADVAILDLTFQSTTVA
jgi:hypothetical protein